MRSNNQRRWRSNRRAAQHQRQLRGQHDVHERQILLLDADIDQALRQQRQQQLNQHARQQAHTQLNGRKWHMNSLKYLHGRLLPYP